MTHRLIALAMGAFGAVGATTAGTSPLITAAIAAVGTILTATIAAWAVRMKSSRRTAATARSPVEELAERYAQELVHRAERAEARGRHLERQVDALELENARLRASLAQVSGNSSSRQPAP